MKKTKITQKILFSGLAAAAFLGGLANVYTFGSLSANAAPHQYEFKPNSQTIVYSGIDSGGTPALYEVNLVAVGTPDNEVNNAKRSGIFFAFVDFALHRFVLRRPDPAQPGEWIIATNSLISQHNLSFRDANLPSGVTPAEYLTEGIEINFQQLAKTFFDVSQRLERKNVANLVPIQRIRRPVGWRQDDPAIPELAQLRRTEAGDLDVNIDRTFLNCANRASDCRYKSVFDTTAPSGSFLSTLPKYVLKKFRLPADASGEDTAAFTALMANRYLFRYVRPDREELLTVGLYDSIGHVLITTRGNLEVDVFGLTGDIYFGHSGITSSGETAAERTITLRLPSDAPSGVLPVTSSDNVMSVHIIDTRSNEQKESGISPSTINLDLELSYSRSLWAGNVMLDDSLQSVNVRFISKGDGGIKAFLIEGEWSINHPTTFIHEPEDDSTGRVEIRVAGWEFSGSIPSVSIESEVTLGLDTGLHLHESVSSNLTRSGKLVFVISDQRDRSGRLVLALGDRSQFIIPSAESIGIRLADGLTWDDIVASLRAEEDYEIDLIRLINRRADYALCIVSCDTVHDPISVADDRVEIYLHSSDGNAPTLLRLRLKPLDEDQDSSVDVSEADGAGSEPEELAGEPQAGASDGSSPSTGTLPSTETQSSTQATTPSGSAGSEGAGSEAEELAVEPQADVSGDDDQDPSVDVSEADSAGSEPEELAVDSQVDESDDDDQDSSVDVSEADGAGSEAEELAEEPQADVSGDDDQDSSVDVSEADGTGSEGEELAVDPQVDVSDDDDQDSSVDVSEAGGAGSEAEELAVDPQVDVSDDDDQDSSVDVSEADDAGSEAEELAEEPQADVSGDDDQDSSVDVSEADDVAAAAEELAAEPQADVSGDDDQDSSVAVSEADDAAAETEELAEEPQADVSSDDDQDSSVDVSEAGGAGSEAEELAVDPQVDVSDDDDQDSSVDVSEADDAGSEAEELAEEPQADVSGDDDQDSSVDVSEADDVAAAAEELAAEPQADVSGDDDQDPSVDVSEADDAGSEAEELAEEPQADESGDDDQDPSVDVSEADDAGSEAEELAEGPQAGDEDAGTDREEQTDLADISRETQILATDDEDTQTKDGSSGTDGKGGKVNTSRELMRFTLLDSLWNSLPLAQSGRDLTVNGSIDLSLYAGNSLKGRVISASVSGGYRWDRVSVNLAVHYANSTFGTEKHNFMSSIVSVSYYNETGLRGGGYLGGGSSIKATADNKFALFLAGGDLAYNVRFTDLPKAPMLDVDLLPSAKLDFALDLADVEPTKPTKPVTYLNSEFGLDAAFSYRDEKQLPNLAVGFIIPVKGKYALVYDARRPNDYKTVLAMKSGLGLKLTYKDVFNFRISYGIELGRPYVRHGVQMRLQFNK